MAAHLTRHQTDLIVNKVIAAQGDEGGGSVQIQYNACMRNMSPGNLLAHMLPITLPNNQADWKGQRHFKRSEYEKALELHPHRNLTAAWSRAALVLKEDLAAFDNNWPAYIHHLENA
jgi:hypothetical protein